MMAPWRLPLDEARPQVEAVHRALPRIQTARLVLRAPVIEDWAALEPIWTTARGCYIGGPFGEEDAYLDFCQSVASWVLRGIGALTIEDRATGEVLGLTGLFIEFGDPELLPELGWLLTAAAEGKGIALEAARAMRAHGLETVGFDAMVSYVHIDNTRSVKLAQRLGAVADPEPIIDADGDTTLIFRHVANGSDESPMEFRRNSDSEKEASDE